MATTPKQTFASNTFGSKTFASKTWSGGSYRPSPPLPAIFLTGNAQLIVVLTGDAGANA